MKLIHKIGFFRLTLVPIGLLIIGSAISNGILGMGIVGGVVLLFGYMNKCLLMGKCDVEDKPKKLIQRTKIIFY